MTSDYSSPPLFHQTQQKAGCCPHALSIIYWHASASPSALPCAMDHISTQPPVVCAKATPCMSCEIDSPAELKVVLLQAFWRLWLQASWLFCMAIQQPCSAVSSLPPLSAS